MDDPEEVLEEVLKDDGFYSRSGGGLTLSGGEPLLQAEFAAELLIRPEKRPDQRHRDDRMRSWKQAEPVFSPSGRDPLRFKVYGHRKTQAVYREWEMNFQKRISKYSAKHFRKNPL